MNHEGEKRRAKKNIAAKGAGRAAAGFVTRSPEETMALAERLARGLPPGTLVALSGVFGAGKTVFVRGLARGMGLKDLRRVTSPSFALLNLYPGRRPLAHFDVHRMASPREIVELVREEAPPGAVCAVEWADKVALPRRIPVVAVEILHAGETRRRIRIRTRGGASAGLLKGRWGK